MGRVCSLCKVTMGMYDPYCFACGSADLPYTEEDFPPDPDPVVSFAEPGAITLGAKTPAKWAKCVHGYSIKEAGCPNCAVPRRDPKQCPDCGQLTIRKNGRFGPFTACSGYPRCRWTVGRERAKQEAILYRQQQTWVQEAEKARRAEEARRLDQERALRRVSEQIAERRKARKMEPLPAPSQPSSRKAPSRSAPPKAPAKSDLEQRFANLDFGDEPEAKPDVDDNDWGF